VGQIAVAFYSSGCKPVGTTASLSLRAVLQKGRGTEVSMMA